LELDRWRGKNPILMIVDGSWNINWSKLLCHCCSWSKKFKKIFIDTGKIESLEDLAKLDWNDQEFDECIPNDRKRQIIVEIARIISTISPFFKK